MTEQTKAEVDLFERVYLYAAHVAILEEALDTAEADFVLLGQTHQIDVSPALERIAIAYSSVDKLKKGMKGLGE